MKKLTTSQAEGQISAVDVHKKEPVPALDPRTPGIYRLILDTAKQIRAERRVRADAQRILSGVMNSIRMREAREFDDELERQKLEQRRLSRLCHVKK